MPNSLDPTKTIMVTSDRESSPPLPLSGADESAPPPAASTRSRIDMDEFLRDPVERMAFTKYLGQFMNGSEDLVTFYMFMYSLNDVHKYSSETIKNLLAKANRLYHKSCRSEALLSVELDQRMSDTLKKSVYNEAVVKEAQKEMNAKFQPYFERYLRARTANSRRAADNLNVTQERLPSMTLTG